MFKWQKLNIITNIIVDLCRLISNIYGGSLVPLLHTV